MLTRTHYWFQHEPCWYVRKKNAPCSGRKREKTRRSGILLRRNSSWAGRMKRNSIIPTQKPVDLMRRPILNHTKRGDLVYEPFLGSGTTLAAAEMSERICYGMDT